MVERLPGVYEACVSSWKCKEKRTEKLKEASCIKLRTLILSMEVPVREEPAQLKTHGEVL